MPGMGELLVILVIVLLIFGAGKLPQIGDSLGRSIRNFKRAASGDNELEVSKRREQIASRSSSSRAEPTDDDDDDEDVVPAPRKKKAPR
jgi:sec-independent protein translocase protein TatA